MSDDRDRDMTTSHLEKRCDTPHRHSASPARALQQARFLDTLPRLISPSRLTILVPSTGREPPDQRLYKNNAGVKVAALQSRTPEGRTRSTDGMPTISPFPDGHSDDSHEKGLPHKLGKSPKMKNETRDYQPILQQRGA